MNVRGPAARWSIALVAALFPVTISAQASADTISGRIVARDSSPVARANVRIQSGATTIETFSDSLGRFHAVVAHHDEHFAAVRAFGFVPLSLIILHSASTHELVRDIRLNAVAVALPTVQVSGQLGRDVPSPADRGESWESNTSSDLPITPGDFAAIAAIQAGVARTGPNLPDISVNGLSPSDNRVTMDGSTFSGSTLPAEGVRSLGFIVNSYDAARGLFTGGQLVATTISGTNKWGGAFSLRADDKRRLTVNSGGGGAPIRGKLFVYGAIDASRTQSGTDESTRDLALSPDSVLRFNQILGTLGIQTVARARVISFLSALGRADYAFSKKHSLTLRADSRQSNAPASTASAGLLAQLTSSGDTWSNDVRVYQSTNSMKSGIAAFVPSGTLEASALLADPTAGDFAIQFGGILAAPETKNGTLELSNDFVRQLPGSTHRLKAGLLHQRQTASLVRNAQGTFTYRSLADLESARPQLFTGTLGSGAKTSHEVTSFYAGDLWHPGPPLGLIYGLRIESRGYSRTPSIASRLVALPRVGFRYDRKGGRSIGIDGGTGLFAGMVNAETVMAMGAGTSEAQSIFTCTGAAVPRPNWAAPIPSACAGGTQTLSSYLIPSPLFAGNFSSPVTWKSTLGGGARLSAAWGARVEASFVSTTALTSSVDRNLVLASRATLSAEDGRPVFAAFQSIDTNTGMVPVTASRIAGASVINEIGSDGKSRTAQVSTSVTGFTRRFGLIALAYTASHSRLFASGTFNPLGAQGSTAGDPRVFEWQSNPYAPKHLFQLLSSRRIGQSWRVSAIGRVQSGTAFTPLVSADINGDGLHNDRAFVFTSESAAGMKKLLTSSTAGVRRCIEEQAGKIARPASCPSSWSSQLDMRAQVEIQPLNDITARMITLSATLSNVTAGLDQFLHGSTSLRNWGQHASADPILLHVRSFNPATGNFNYTVNTNFGKSILAPHIRSPFRLILEGRITVGADPRAQPLVQRVDAMINNSISQMRVQIAEKVRNVPAIILQLAAADPSQLNLSIAQRARLQSVADSLAPQISMTVTELAESIWKKGTMTALRQAQIEEGLDAASSLVRGGANASKAILSADQWTRLPRWVTQPFNADDVDQLEVEIFAPSGT